MERSGLDIAIVAMVCRLPGAPDIEAYWRNLVDGVDSIGRFAPAEMLADGVPQDASGAAGYVPAGGIIEDADCFDAAFFDVSPREAELTDPQQRLFLEAAWEVLEQAGYDASSFAGDIGVYAGMGMNSYFLDRLHHPGELPEPIEAYRILFGNNKDHLATRTCYKLGLTGPGITVQTACSTGLVAVHMASRALLGGECDLALAGAVSVRVPQRSGYPREASGLLSPDGCCRPFDARANGTVFGSGLGIVALRRLEDALEDGDHIRAVVRATAVNNDGSDKVAYPAPGVRAQTRVIRAALRLAEVSAGDISFVEGHGTGTGLGDPIEVSALTEAFRSDTDGRGYCVLGSAKGNIGHVDTAAGMAGLIKAVMALERRTIPGTAHFERPNPQLALESTPFLLTAAPVPWPEGRPGLAGVSSFGMGGTNAHAVLEAWDPVEQRDGTARPWQLLQVSARTPEALSRHRMRLASALAGGPQVELADVCHTLRVGRRPFEHRLAVTARDPAEAEAALRDPSRGAVGSSLAGPPPVVMLFSGQGGQRAGAGCALYSSEPVFREAVDECRAHLGDVEGHDLRDVLWRLPQEQLDRTVFAQPALFVLGVALARLWEARGVLPVAMAGHSVGEVTAACAAGALDLGDALGLVRERGRLLEDLPHGRMLAVELAANELAPLPSGVVVAAVNTPTRCVVSGPSAELLDLQGRLEGRGVATRLLHTTRAFHSPMVEPALAGLAEAGAACRVTEPRVPLVSNLTGTWHEAATLADGTYWARHAREPVLFAAGVAAIAEAHPGAVFLEAGPGRALAAAVRAAGGTPVASLADPDGDADEQLAAAGAKLWANGFVLDAAGMTSGERRRRVPLPGYPFERTSYWAADPPPAARTSRRRHAESSRWLYAPRWTETDWPAGDERDDRPTTVLVGPAPAVSVWADRLRDDANEVVALPLDSVDELPPGPLQVVHLAGASDLDGVSAALSVVDVARGLSDDSSLVVITTGTVDVSGQEPVQPDRAAVSGVCLSTLQEGLDCRQIDIDQRPDAISVELLRHELRHGEGLSVAHRGGRRWIRTFEPITVDRTPTFAGGTFALVGGGNVGRAVARHLASEGAARVTVVCRRAPDDAPRLVAELERLGAGMAQICVADVSDPESLGRALDQAAGSDRLDGVVLAAGTRFRQPLERFSAEDFSEHVSSRSDLGRALAAALGDRQLGFCAIVSSLAATVGGRGLAAYAASHAVLDALALEQRRSGRPWVTVDCDNWLADQSDLALGLAESAPAMTSDEGASAFLRAALHLGSGQVIVCTTDVTARLRHTPAAVPRAPAARHDAHLAPHGEHERRLAAIWERLLGVERVGAADDFYALGGDSLVAIQMIAAANQEGLRLTTRQLLENSTLGELAAVCTEAQARPSEPVTGRAPLLPAQHAFLVDDPVEPAWFDQAVCLEVLQPIEPTLLREALSLVVDHHDGLRARFTHADGVWTQTIAEPGEPAVVHDVALDAGVSFAEASSRTDAALEVARATFDLEAGPLLCAVHVSGQGSDRLIVVAHHLLVDAPSWRVVLEDLLVVYQQLLNGVPPVLPAPSSSAAEWAQWLVQDPPTEEEAAYWTALGEDDPWPRPGVVGEEVSSQVELDDALSQRLQEGGRVPADLCIAALARAVGRWIGRESVLVDVETHGRAIPLDTQLDLSRTVGWLTTTYPVRLPAVGGDLDSAAHAADDAIHAVPRGGVGFGVLRMRGTPALPQAQVSFVYLGDPARGLVAPGLVRMDPERSGVSRSPAANRRWPLACAASLVDGRLRLELRGSGSIGQETVDALLRDAVSELAGLQAGAPARVDAPQQSPLVRLSRGDGPPVFFVHPAGGSVLCYGALARALDGTPFYGLQGRGPETGESPDETVSAMAERYLEAVRSVRPRGPYLLGGWSFGGVVALEMALRLQAVGEDASLLVVDTRPPVAAPPVELPSEDELYRVFLRGTSMLGQELLPMGGGAVPASEQLEQAFAAWRAHLRALADYVPRTRYQGSVGLVLADDPVPIRLPLLDGKDPGALVDGWGTLCTQTPRARSVPGNHFTLVGPTYVGPVADAVRLLLMSGAS